MTTPLMCQLSKVAEDWITKGCHIRIKGVELAIYPDHLGGLGFRSVFSSTPLKKVHQAIKIVTTKCLRDPKVRKQWIARLNAARLHMLSYPDDSLANGRMLEFKRLRLAIERLL